MEKYLQGFVIFLSCISAVFCCHGTLMGTGINEHEKSIILQEHNRLRATVAMGNVPNQPGAENMREMKWDEELATRAQQWANNCQFKHDPHRTIDRFTMGQNMAIIWSTADIADEDGDFPSRIQSWFNEVQKYAFGSAWSPKTGHYSQLVWGETNLIGCGFSYYKDTKKYNKLYVCNYGPGGNVVGDNPYEVGRPACKNYGMKPSHQYQGLCSSPSTGSQQNSIDTTFTFKSTSYTNSKSSYNNQYQQQQQQQQQPQQPPQQSYYHQQHQQQQQTQPQRPSPFNFHSSYHYTQQQQQTKPSVNPNYDYSFKSFFKQTKKPSYDW